VGPAGSGRLDRTGTLLCQNVFRTKQTAADLGRIKAVRVYEGRPFTLRSVRHGLVHLGVESRELGTAPLAPDGSFYVRVPADRALAIQAVDAEGRPVINELTWIYVRPGERRTCVGCHSPRPAAPRPAVPLAVRWAPADLTGRGRPHRYRGNNGANGGVLNLQLDRFREIATIDLYSQPPLPAASADAPLPPGRPAEVARLCGLLAADAADARISAARRLAVFRDRAAAGPLCAALGDSDSAVRAEAAMALAACGNRQAAGPLTAALADSDPRAAQAAHVALENLTGRRIAFNAFAAADKPRGLAAWRAWHEGLDWPAVETDLIARLGASDAVVVHKAIEALGHVGADRGRAALRDWLAKARADDKSDLRAVMAAMRALGHLRDAKAVGLLGEILARNIVRNPPKRRGLAELGWLQRPTQLAATAAEALGWIGTGDSRRHLLAAWPKLRDFWVYTWWMGHHDWLRGCHACGIHFRILEALDAAGAGETGPLVPGILRSVPIDPDRALLFECDGYEVLTARVVQRSGRAPEVLEACLAVLGDPQARARPTDKQVHAAVTASPPAREVKPMSPESRAAQIASVVCLDARQAPRLRAAFDRYRAAKPSRTRSWVCFYLARALGKMRDRGSVGSLLAAVDDDPTEMSFGLEDPPHVFLYKAMTPFYRAAAADALGRIGHGRAVDSLFKAVANFDNAMAVRHASARALGMLCRARHVRRLAALAEGYSEVATRRALQESGRQAARRR
jgi:HEAT repeat protein